MLCLKCDQGIVNCDCPDLQEKVESLRDAQPPCIFYPQLKLEFELCMARRVAQFQLEYDWAARNSQN